MLDEYSPYDILNHTLLISREQLTQSGIVEWVISPDLVAVLLMGADQWYELDPSAIQTLARQFEIKFLERAQRIYSTIPFPIKVVISPEPGPVSRARKQTRLERVRHVWRRILGV